MHSFLRILLVVTLIMGSPASTYAESKCNLVKLWSLLTGAVSTKSDEALRSALMRKIADGASKDEAFEARIDRIVLGLDSKQARRLASMLESFEGRVDAANFPDFQKAALRSLRFPDENRLAYYFDIYSNYGGVSRQGASVIDGAFERVAESEDPYSSAYYLGGGEPSKRAQRVRDLLNFEKLVQSKKSRAQVAKATKHWVKSDEHALYLFQHLGELGEHGPAVLEYLMRETEYFKDVGRIRGPPYTAVTFAFEKETRNAGSTLFYKLPEYSDSDWIELPEERRIELLKSATGIKEKRFLPASVIAPTAVSRRIFPGVQRHPRHRGLSPSLGIRSPQLRF